MSETTWTARRTLWWALLCLLPVLVVMPIALTAAVARDEQMYVTAGVLVRDHALYTDFAYFQMPYLPWIYRRVLELASGSVLLPLRLFTALCFWMLAVVVGRLARELAASSLVGITAAAAVLASETVLRAGSAATNHVPSLLFFALTLLALQIAQRSEDRTRWIAGSGLCLGIAIGLRSSYAVFLILLLPLLLLDTRPQKSRALLGFVAGLGLALLPALFVFLRDPRAFWFDNLGYHFVNTRYWQNLGIEHTMTWPSKLDDLWDTLKQSSHVPILVAAVAATVLACFGCGSRARVIALAGGGAFAFASVWALLRSPVPAHYYLPVVLLMILWAAAAIAGLGGWKRRAATGLLVVGALVAVGDAAEDLGHAWGRWRDREHWVTHAIRRELTPYGDRLAGSLVATLTPVAVLEIGATVPVEFSTGPFLFRVGELLEPEQRSRHHGSSASSVAALLDERRPAAVLTGSDGSSIPWDRALAEWASAQSYAAHALPDGAGVLWLRP